MSIVEFVESSRPECGKDAPHVFRHIGGRCDCGAVTWGEARWLAWLRRMVEFHGC